MRQISRKMFSPDFGLEFLLRSSKLRPAVAPTSIKVPGNTSFKQSLQLHFLPIHVHVFDSLQYTNAHCYLCLSIHENQFSALQFKSKITKNSSTNPVSCNNGDMSTLLDAFNS